jgi:hypothetical protein
MEIRTILYLGNRGKTGGVCYHSFDRLIVGVMRSSFHNNAVAPDGV